MDLHGTWVALVTPFSAGQIDEPALRELIRRCVDGGVSGLVPCGTTGEAATLSEVEYHQVLAITMQEAGGRVPVIAGTGTNSTDGTLRKTRLAREIGCAGALVVTPYYNKPTQAGLEAHYRAVALGVPDLPLVLYNVPGRTGVNLLPETVARLAELDSIVAIKEASGSVVQAQEVLERCGGRLALLAGDDALALPLYAVGAKGVVSVAANVLPDRMSALWARFWSGDHEGATSAQQALFPLFQALFIEPNPVPCKAALALLGVCSDEVRLPLLPASPDTRARLRRVLDALDAAPAR